MGTFTDMDEIINLIVEKEDEKQRLDVYISCNIEDLTRSSCQKLINNGLVKVNSEGKKTNYKVKHSDNIEITIQEPEDLNIEPENIPLDVIYEDEALIVINKPQGMVVHPAPGNYSGTLVNALLYHCKGNLSGINGVKRPGIVHRIDKDTSGVLVIAKNNEAHVSLAEQIKEHTVNREYIALLHGKLKSDKGTIKTFIGRHKTDRKKMAVLSEGKHAVTHFEVLKNYDKYTLIKAKLETGRTHQIRVHMSHISHPVVGDPVYGPKDSPFKLNGQLLHAQTLGFIHPIKKEYVEFSAPLPDYFTKVLNSIV
jgi:23S rRNA pseudouridine1911/1915/1917 synthase